MRADANSDDRSGFEQIFDLCVIGAGPAGITLARKLAAAGASVALMEAGGMELSAESQDLYLGENIGLDYFSLDTPRLRYFGGTSNHWAGWCRALDPVDFLAKPFNTFSGWPINRIELDPFRREADEILDLVSESEAPDLPFKQDYYRFKRFQFRWSPPTRFHDKYIDEITASENIHLWLNANLVALPLDDALGNVAGATFKSYAAGDPGFTVKARQYALCTGGIENARLLLAMNAQVPEGIGNRHDLVGRFFCDHPHFVTSDVILRAPMAEREYFAPTEEFILENQVTNFGLRLEPEYFPPPATLGAAAVRDLACGGDFTERLAERVLGEAGNCDLGGVADYYANRDTVIEPLAITRIAFEQAQNPNSRVMLSEDRDPFGLQTVVLDWQFTDLDIHTMRTAVMAFGEHLAEQDLGRLRVRDWLLADPAEIPGIDKDEVAGKHHMCATRMAADPRHGVVNADCRVHGLDNLYVGGSSTFATPGHANPTYTIVQLALRLGDHLTARLRG